MSLDKDPNKIKEIDLLQEEINKYRPLSDKEIASFRKYFKIGLTYSSNALEGNSITETETKVILDADQAGRYRSEEA